MNTNWPRSHVYILLKIWLLSSYSCVEETGTSTCTRMNNYLFIYPRRIFFPKKMVTLALGWLRMRKISGKATVPLDAVPERRTERCSPRFRPGGRFWGEPRFRYLSPGSEGEKCRPLDHLWQTPFIHSARYINSSKSHIYRTVFHLSPPFGTFKSVLLRCLFCNCACTFGDQLLQAIIILVFHTVHASAYWHKSKSIYACAFGEQAKLFPRHFRAPSEEINGSNYVGKTAPPQLPAPIIDKLIDIVFLT